MESQMGTQLKVGIFLTIGIAVVLASIFMLGADRALFKTYIHIHAHFSQVQGLAEGSVVSLSGITVGNIEAIVFEPEHSTVDVAMKIDETFAKIIAKDAQVEIQTQGALGDKFIFIAPGDLKNGIIAQGDTLQVAKASDLLGIISERGKDTGKIFDIIDDVYKMTKQITSENRMGKIMVNMATASENLSAASADAKKMIALIDSRGNTEKIQESIAHVNSILAKIDSGQGTLGALINDPSLHNQLKSYLGVNSHKSNLKYLMRTSIEKDGE